MKLMSMWINILGTAAGAVLLLIRARKEWWEGKQAKLNAAPQIVVEYECHGFDKAERHNPLTLHNRGAPAHNVQIKDIRTDFGRVSFACVPQLEKGEPMSVQPEVEEGSMQHRDFIGFLDSGWKHVKNRMLVLPIHVSCSSNDGKRFRRKFEIVYNYKTGFAQARLASGWARGLLTSCLSKLRDTRF